MSKLTFQDLIPLWGTPIPTPVLEEFTKENTCTFTELTTNYGSEVNIPDSVLYNFINHPDKRASLAGSTLEAIKESRVGQEVRRRAKSDLYFLARYILWETNPEGIGKDILDNLIEEPHRVICDFFVKKDDKKSLADQDIRKNRILLWPRGGFKSTIDICDVVQWILNFPDVRILFLTAADDLASGFVDETKGHFRIRKTNPSLMNIFFPEYCVEDKNQWDQYHFACPLWEAKQDGRKEPTVTASSIVSTLSGFHYEVMKADDTVSNKNSENEEQCARVIKNFFINRKMLRPFGYCDLIGTRYNAVDMYGVALDNNIGEIQKKDFGPCVEIIDNLTSGLRVLIGKAIVIKSEAAVKLADERKKITYPEAGEDGCDLLIPKIYPYARLMKELNDDEVSFEGQFNQNPNPVSTTVFDRSLLVASTVSFSEMPFRGPVSQTWDFAFSAKKGRDYTTASNVIWNDKGQFFVTDILRGRYKPHDLAKAVVDFAVKWRPYIIGIEDASGSKLLEPTIISEANKTGDAYIINICSHIDWYPTDLHKDSKRMRMASLHPWMVDGNMKFANYLPILETIYNEFEKCLSSHKHDDIPDVLSQQPRYAPRMAQLIQSKELQTFSRLDAAWNLLFEENTDAFGNIGLGSPYINPLETVKEEPEEIRAETPEGLPNVLGAGLFG